MLAKITTTLALRSKEQEKETISLKSALNGAYYVQLLQSWGHAAAFRLEGDGKGLCLVEGRHLLAAAVHFKYAGIHRLTIYNGPKLVLLVFGGLRKCIHP